MAVSAPSTWRPLKPGAPMSPQVLRLSHCLDFLSDSDRWPQEKIEHLRRQLLLRRLSHAAERSRFFSRRLDPVELAQAPVEQVLSGLPWLSRADLQAHATDIYCELPPEQGPVQFNRTTGSTGQPVSVRCNAAAYAWRDAAVIRNFSWFELDVNGTLAAIRSDIKKRPPGARLPTWGGSVARLYETGPSHGLSLATEPVQQIAWLNQIRPQYLITYPSNLAVLLDSGLKPWPGLNAILTLGDHLSEEVRGQAKERLGVPLFDQYSSEEMGVMAAQCAHGGYHVMEELVHIEIVREDGSPCEIGEPGRIVATDLRNLASAMIRYDLRDHAQWAPACPCGRHSRVIQQILGRTRNRLTLRDGKKIWPNTGLRNFHLLPIRQFQLIQNSLDQLTLKLCLDTSPSATQQAAVVQHVQRAIGQDFDIRLELHHDPLPFGPGGKFEQFISEVP